MSRATLGSAIRAMTLLGILSLACSIGSAQTTVDSGNNAKRVAHQSGEKNEQARRLEAAIEAAARAPARSADEPSAEYVRHWISAIEGTGGGDLLRSTAGVGGDGDALVSVAIERDGTVHDMRVLRSSGEEGVDAAVVLAIRAAAPFSPVPREIGEQLYITRAWRALPGLTARNDRDDSKPQPRANERAIAIQGNWPQAFRDSLRYRRVAATKFPDGRKSLREYLATVTIAIRKRGNDATTLAWTYTHMTLNGKALADLTLELSVASDGSVSLVNADALQRTIQQAASAKDKSTTTGEFSGDELVKFAANKDLLTSFYLRDPDIFFYPLGTTVKRDTPTDIDNEIEGLDDTPLKAVDRWTVLPQHGAPAGTIALEWAQVIDRHDVERYYAELVRRLGAKVDTTQGELTKKGLYALDATTFWPHVVLASTKVAIQDQYEQVDVIEMRSSLLDPGWKH